MPKKPSIPHKVITEFILSGHTTRDTKEHFGFASDNIANLRVYAAFKALGIPRPQYREPRNCEFCGKQFTARDFKQRTCGESGCQTALIVDWHKKNSESGKKALQKYRGTEKGRQNNINTHRRIRERGLYDSSSQRWHFATLEIKKSLRKLSYLAFRSPWEYRIQHIQNLAKLEREFTPRNKPRRTGDVPSEKWNKSMRSVQTAIIQYRATAVSSIWEKAVNRINHAIRTGRNVRGWKRKQRKRQSLLIT